MFTGEYVRRAASTVGSVASAAASAAASVANLDSSRSVNLTVKAMPPRSASVTANSALKSGFLWKQNAQGQWIRRFVCLVPHTFIYYYDSPTSESPRGIIDCELLTDVRIVNVEGPPISKNVIISSEDLDGTHASVSPTALSETQIHVFHAASPSAAISSPSDNNHQHFNRRFLFAGDEADTDAWLNIISRSHYSVLAEETTAYRSAIDSLTAEVASIDELRRSLDEANKSLSSARRGFQRALAYVGVTDSVAEDLAKADFSVQSDALCERISRISVSHAAEIEKCARDSAMAMEDALELAKKVASEEIAQLKASHESAVEGWSAVLADARCDAATARQSLQESEALVANLKEELEATRSEVDAAKDNINRLISTASTLTEEKKLLVREIKTQRIALTEAATSTAIPLQKRIEALETANMDLLKRLVALQEVAEEARLAEIENSIPEILSSPRSRRNSIDSSQLDDSRRKSITRRGSFFGNLFGGETLSEESLT